MENNFIIDSNGFSAWKPQKVKAYEPDDNSEYIKHGYWNDRFKEEDEYEWLVSYKHVRK